MSSMSGIKRTFKIGGKVEVSRLGFGAMRIVGDGVWGPPKDPEGVLATLRRLPELGINFIDTANSYGPYVSEELISKALHPYTNVVVATKAGLARNGPDSWFPNGDPVYLIREAYASRERLNVEAIALWQLHRIDPRVPADEQFSAIRQLLDEKVIVHAGLSEVSVEDIQNASRFFDVASVQNRYNFVDRGSDEVLDHCERRGIAFIPWFPLGAGGLTAPRSALNGIAERHAASPGQIAIAWLLRRSPVIIPIPGTSKVEHLEENARAIDIELSDEEFAALDSFGSIGS